MDGFVGGGGLISLAFERCDLGLACGQVGLDAFEPGFGPFQPAPIGPGQPGGQAVPPLEDQGNGGDHRADDNEADDDPA